MEKRRNRLSDTLCFRDPVTTVKLVSPARAKALAGLGIDTVGDLLAHYPRRYIDLTQVVTIRQARIGQSACLYATVHKIVLKRPKPRLQLVEITLIDGTGTMMVTCFKQPWLIQQIKEGDRLSVAGKVEFNFGFKRMTNPFIEINEDALPEGRVIPVHGACEAISPAWMRRLVSNALAMSAGCYDPLPLALRTKYRLMSRGSALRAIHFPHSMNEVREAKRRLIFEEVFLLELRLMRDGVLRRLNQPGFAQISGGRHCQSMLEHLPFTLTESQQGAMEEIFSQMAKPDAMHHLLLGDVGTGKTILAALSMAVSVDAGNQAMCMAPTEVLALQHFETFQPLFDQTGIRVALLCGSTSAEDKERICGLFAAGELDVLVGTHALLEPHVVAHRVGLVVIDEQQRFGVRQRQAIIEKAPGCDVLSLSATPIPRTLALTLYGDMSISYLKQRPHAEAKRVTRVLRKDAVDIAYSALHDAIERGEQGYIVCPLIGVAHEEQAADEEGEQYCYAAVQIEGEGDYGAGSITAAESLAQSLARTQFCDRRIGLLHGRLSADEKEAIMRDFSNGEIDVLIATTVIEVGVDVPNATVMVVMDADRFGLSQLHQLRGRVGRGTKSAQVFLVSDSPTENALKRLQAMESCEDGFELATYDLSLRREGDIFGNRQHGTSVLKLVNVVRDAGVIETAHNDAQSLLRDDPLLESEDHALLIQEMNRLFPNEQE